MSACRSAGARRLFRELGDTRSHRPPASGARDGRGRHEKRSTTGSWTERHALMHAEAVLLVDHGERQVGELDIPPAPGRACRPRAGSNRRQPLERLSLEALAVAPGQQRILTPAASASAQCGVVWRAQKLVGAIRGRLRTRFRRRSTWRGKRPTSLPLPTSPCSSRTMRFGLGMSVAISSIAAFWLAVSSKGSRGEGHLVQAPVALVARPARVRVVWRTSADGELACQKLVEQAARADAGATDRPPRRRA